MKKTVSIFLTASLVISMFVGTVVTTSALTIGSNIGDLVIDGAKEPVVLTGENAKFLPGYTARWVNGANINNISSYYNIGECSANNALTITAEDENGVNSDAYGSNGTSIKSVVTDSHDFDIVLGEDLKNHSTAVNGHYSRISFDSWDNITAKEGVSIAFWIKTQQPVKITAALSTSTSKAATSDEITVPSGTSVVEIPLENFALNHTGFVVNGSFIINKYYIYYRPVNGYSSTPVTIYFDNIGYYTKTPARKLEMRNKAVEVYDFEKIKNGTNTDGQPAIVEDGHSYKAEAYGNGTNTLSVESTKAVLPFDSKIIWDFDSYTDISQSPLQAKSDGWNGYSEFSLNADTAYTYGSSGKSLKFSWTSAKQGRILHNAEFTQKSGEGMAFWIWTEEEVDITVAFNEDWATERSKTVSLVAGENIVKIRYSDFEGYTGGKITQLHIDPAYGSQGTLWLDSFVTFTESDIEYFNPNTYGGTGKSLHYYTDKANSGYNGIKLNFTKIPLVNDDIIWGQDATVCIWFNSSRSVPVYFKAQDSEQWHSGEATWWKTKDYTIPAGESVMRIPVSEFNIVATAGTREDLWEYLGSLTIEFPWDADNSEYDLYIDQISVEFPTIGDANDDESIDIRDLINLKKKLSAADKPTLIKAIDVNADGKFDVKDIAKFTKYLLGADTLASAPLPTGYIYLEPTEPAEGYTQIVSLVSNSDDTNVQGALVSVNDVKTTTFQKAMKLTMGDSDAYFSNQPNISYYLSWNTVTGNGAPVDLGDAVANGYLELWIKTPYATNIKLIAVAKGYYPTATLVFTTSDSTDWQKITLPVAQFKDGGESMSYNGIVEFRIAADSQETFIWDGDSLEIGSLTFFCPTEDVGTSGANKVYPIPQNELTSYTGENFKITYSTDSPWSDSLVYSYGGVAKDDVNYSKFRNITTVKLNTATNGFDVAIAKETDNYGRVLPIDLDDYILTGTIRTYVKVSSVTELSISLKNGYANSSASIAITKTIDPADAVDGYVELIIPIKEFYNKTVKDNSNFRFDKFGSIGIKANGDFSDTEELVYSNFEVWAKEAPDPTAVDTTTKYTCANGSGIILIDADDIMPEQTVVKAFRNEIEDLSAALAEWSPSAVLIDNYYIGTVSDSELSTPISPAGNICFSIPKSYLYDSGNITAENINTLNAAFYSNGVFKSTEISVSEDCLLIYTDTVGDLIFFTGQTGTDGIITANTLSVSLVADHPGIPGYDAVYEVKVYDNGTEISPENYTLSCYVDEVITESNKVIIPASFKDSTSLKGIKIYAAANSKTAFYPLMIKNWTLTMEDEFDGTKLDNTVWSDSSASAKSVSVSNGKLSMRIVENNDGQYIDPRVSTSRKFEQQYGCFVASIQMPQTTSGVVSAFWLLPSNYNKHWGTSYLFDRLDGDACGEVDIIEYSSSWDGTAQSALQCWDPVTMEKTGAFEVGHFYEPLKPNNGYVEIAGVWTENAVYIYYGGQLQRVVKNISATGEKAQMVLSMHSNWGGFTGDDIEKLECLVDYVRAYK